MFGQNLQRAADTRAPPQPRPTSTATTCAPGRPGTCAGANAYLVCTGTNGSEYVEKLDATWTNGTGNVPAGSEVVSPR